MVSWNNIERTLLVLMLFVVNGSNERQWRGESRAYSSDQFTVFCWDSIVRTWLVLDRAVSKECSGEESRSELTAQVGLSTHNSSHHFPRVCWYGIVRSRLVQVL